MKKEDKLLMNHMIDKSQQSFLLAIELYNKPTIKINVESFCIFICNAWELMFKAYLLSIGEPIYHKKGGAKTNRTLDLTKLMKKIMPNAKDPARINLETVIGIRNKATHLIIPEYASIFHDVFLACVRNYTEKMQSLLKVSINDLFDSTFLSLVIPTSNTSINVLGKYGKTIQYEYYNINKYLDETYKSTANENGIVNDKFAIGHEIRFIRVKDKDDANLKIANFKDDEAKQVVKIIETADAAVTHPLTHGKIVQMVKNELSKNNITFVSYTQNQQSNFTTDTLNLYIRVNKIKEYKEYAYKHQTASISYTYSHKLVEKIIQDITDDPEIFVKLKNQIKKD